MDDRVQSGRHNGCAVEGVFLDRRQNKRLLRRYPQRVDAD